METPFVQDDNEKCSKQECNIVPDDELCLIQAAVSSVFSTSSVKHRVHDQDYGMYSNSELTKDQNLVTDCEVKTSEKKYPSRAENFTITEQCFNELENTVGTSKNNVSYPFKDENIVLKSVFPLTDTSLNAAMNSEFPSLSGGDIKNISIDCTSYVTLNENMDSQQLTDDSLNTFPKQECKIIEDITEVSSNILPTIKHSDHTVKSEPDHINKETEVIYTLDSDLNSMLLTTFHQKSEQFSMKIDSEVPVKCFTSDMIATASDSGADIIPDVIEIANDSTTNIYTDTVSIQSDSNVLNFVCAPCSEDESDTLLSELESELEGCGSENCHTSPSIGPNGLNSTILKDLNNSAHIKKQHRITTKENYRVNNAKDRPTIEYYEAHMEFLEKNNSHLKQELSEMKERFVTSETEYKKRLGQNKAEMMVKLEKISKLYDSARKDKEAMVVRYAQSERDVILAKKAREELEKKLRDAAKERENFISKVKGLNMERMRICSSLDNKMVELASLQREHEKLKEDLNAKDIRIKWGQNKLRTEMDAHKETQSKLDHTLHRLQDTREEAEQVRRDCQEMIRRYQEAEEIKSVSLDHQLRQKLNELEVQKQERSDQEEVYQLLRQEMEALKKKHKLTIEENNTLTVKINSLEKERLDHEQTVSKLKDSQNSLKQDVVDLTARLAEMENLRMQLEREKEKLAASQREVERLRHTNAELQADMEACHNKEGELLEFTERLTAKSVHLQSEHSLLETKAQTLDEEMSRFSKKCSELEQKNIELNAQIEEEQKQREEETQLLARKLAEKTKAVEQLTVKLEEAENENRVMKRRHITSIKELSRELQHTKKKLEIFEASQLTHGDCLSVGSRASSTGSLDTLSNNHPIPFNGPSVPLSAPQAPPPVAFSGGKNVINTQYKQPSQTSPPPTVSLPNEVDKQMLIERIVWLQKSLARKNEKIEFLEEHISQLLIEIKKKSKIIQSYIIREEAGALVSNSMDQNKMELSRHGGIMASVYSSHPADNHLTLELSLEINQKLQAVLEDTLLKNITLKENISTLGEEIARLTKEQRELNNLLQRNKYNK